MRDWCWLCIQNTDGGHTWHKILQRGNEIWDVEIYGDDVWAISQGNSLHTHVMLTNNDGKKRGMISDVNINSESGRNQLESGEYADGIYSIVHSSLFS